jgi:hypothetical protein
MSPRVHPMAESWPGWGASSGPSSRAWPRTSESQRFVRQWVALVIESTNSNTNIRTIGAFGVDGLAVSAWGRLRCSKSRRNLGGASR